jgi:hypothetical protein
MPLNNNIPHEPSGLLIAERALARTIEALGRAASCDARDILAKRIVSLRETIARLEKRAARRLG